MEYPGRLLPQSHYKKLTDFQQLSKFYLLHFVDPGVPCKTARDITRCIASIMIPSRYEKGMSFSLYSRIKIEDMKFELNDPLGAYFVDWNEGMMGTMPSPSNVHVIIRRRVVAVKVSDVLSLRAKSHIGQDDKKEMVTITFIPEHAPVAVNYWHVNLFPIAHKDSDKSIVPIVNKKAKRMTLALNDEFAKIIHPASKNHKRYLEKAIYQY